MDQTQNSFLEGIIGDRTPLDSDPKSLTDAVNATVFSNKGDQMVERIMKSTTPVIEENAEPIKKFTGLPKENKILGIKTFNDIAYIISGKPAVNTLEASNTGHAQKTPSKIYREKVGANGRGIDPDRYTYQQIDDNSGRITLINQDQIIDEEYGGWLEGHQTKTDEITQYIWTAPTAGEYTFRFNGMAYISEGTGWSVAGRFHVEKENGSILPDSVMEQTEHSYETSYTTSKEFQANLAEGDKLYVYVKATGRSKYTWKLRADVALFMENGPNIAEPEDSKINDFTTTVTKINPTNELSFGGSFNFPSPCPSGEYDYWYIKIDSGEYQRLNPGDTFDTLNYDFGISPAWPKADGLPPGSYNVTVKYTHPGDAATYTRTELITLTAPPVDTLTVNTELYNFTSIDESFLLAISVKDSDTDTKTYRFGYIRRNTDSDGVVHEETIEETVQADKCVFEVSALGQDGNLEIFVEEHTKHPDITIPDTLADTAEIKRKAVTTLQVYKELANKKYNVEIGTFPSPNYEGKEGDIIKKYSPLKNYNNSDFIAKELFLTGDRYLDVEIQQVYDDTVNILYTEPGFDQRCINSGFAILPDKQYAIRTGNSSKSTNKYTSDNIETKTRLVQRTSAIPEVNLQQIPNSGGNLEIGTYQYYIKLGTADGNETGILAESGLIPIFHGDTMGTVKGGKAGERTQRSVEFNVNNIDKGFSHVTLYYIHNTGDDRITSAAYKVDKKYQLPEGGGDYINNFKVTHSGFEPVIQIPESELSEIKDYYSSINTLVQIQDRLIIGNLRSFNIDYNKLFEVGRHICATPSSKTSYAVLSPYEEMWGANGMWTLPYYAKQFFSEKLYTEAPIPDINKPIKGKDKKYFYNILNQQGLHNPLFAAQYAPYWPMETYKLAVCFVLEGEITTKPIPILAGDFSNYKNFTRSGEKNIIYRAIREQDSQWEELEIGRASCRERVCVGV